MTTIEKTVCEICGDITEKGYALNIDGVNVPVYIGKDATTVYPEIRITPFIDEYDVHFDRFIVPSLTRSVQYYIGIFQIDIYSEDLIQLDKIKKEIRDRIYYLFNLEFMDFEYTKDFAYDNQSDCYFNYIYTDTDDNCFRDISKIKFGNDIITRVDNFNDLVNDSWYQDEDGLYIKLSDKHDIKDVKVVILQQGMKFENGDLMGDRNIIAHKITRKSQLSELENNEVERYSFDIALLFGEEFRNRKLPNLQDIKIRMNYNDR
jgi:hypothetical protein